MLSVRIWRKFKKQISNGKHIRKLNFSTENVQGKTEERGPARMAAWQIHSYGGLEELQLSNSARLPSINSPNDVLIKVQASSVNPIDIMMLSGYGSSLLNTLRQFERGSLVPELEFPLVLGRDCCGQVVSKGNSVGNVFNVGDTVYGVVPVHLQGCHAQNVILNKNLVRKKPETVTPEEATSLIYTGMTAWSALKVSGDLWLLPSKTKKVLVIGASGGVGTVATQLLKAWEAEVVAVCNKDAVPLVKSLNADHVIDYTTPEAMDQITALGKYDVILDAAGLVETESLKYIPLLKDWSLAKYITLRSPFLRNFDTYGLLPGIVQNAKDILFPNISTGAITRGSSVRWAFFLPIPDALNEIDQLIAAKKIQPVIHKAFGFSDLPNAYKEVQSGHLRGKVVIINT